MTKPSETQHVWMDTLSALVLTTALALRGCPSWPCLRLERKKWLFLPLWGSPLFMNNTGSYFTLGYSHSGLRADHKSFRGCCTLHGIKKLYYNEWHLEKNENKIGLLDTKVFHIIANSSLCFPYFFYSPCSCVLLNRVKKVSWLSPCKLIFSCNISAEPTARQQRQPYIKMLSKWVISEFSVTLTPWISCL